jgi:Ca2+:H+ antiporter
VNKLREIIFEEISFILIILTTTVFLLFGDSWLAELSDYYWSGFLFLWLFVVMLWASFSVVKHADGLAVILGEPFGTLILTISVISIEVIMVSALMLTGDDNPRLGRDCDTSEPAGEISL